MSDHNEQPQGEPKEAKDLDHADEQEEEQSSEECAAPGDEQE